MSSPETQGRANRHGAEDLLAALRGNGYPLVRTQARDVTGEAMQRRHRLVFAGLFTLLAVFLVSARCVEHEALRKGPDGDWHIYGEIYNDTDVQGLNMVIDGAFLDASGAETRTARAVMCPGSLSPGTFSAYDIRFPNTSVIDRPEGFKVKVVDGNASGNQLTALHGAYQDVTASARLDLPDLVNLSATFALEEDRSRREATPVQSVYLYCVVMYGPDGNVVGIIGPRAPTSVTKTAVLLDSKHSTAPIITPSDTDPMPLDAVEVRFLLWKANADASAAPLTKVAISIRSIS